MKKLLLGLMSVLAVLFVGCTPVEEMGDYKEGTYFGYAKDESSRPYNAIAVVHVGENGKIDSVFIDATYTKDSVPTTKKVLGDEYGMKSASPIGKEWYEQAEALEAKVIEEQGIDFITYNEDNETTDSVSGVTIKINILEEAVTSALEQAK